MTEYREIRAESFGARSLAALKGTLCFPKMAMGHKYLLANFFRREFLGRFKGSMFGFGWVLVQPLFMFSVYFMVFGFLFDQLGGREGKPPGWFAFYLFSGLVTWMLFSTTIPKATTVIQSNGGLIKKVAFPSDILVLPQVMVSLLVLGVGLVVVAIVGLLWWLIAGGTGPLGWPGWKMIYILPLALEAGLFTLGFGMLVATIFVFIRDIGEILPVVMQFWFFSTPIFWEPSRTVGLEENYPLIAKLVSVLLVVNPFYHYVMGMRAAVGVFDHPGLSDAFGFTTPEALALRSCLIGIVPALLAFLVGGFLFNLHKQRFSDEV